MTPPDSSQNCSRSNHARSHISPAASHKFHFDPQHTPMESPADQNPHASSHQTTHEEISHPARTLLQSQHVAHGPQSPQSPPADKFFSKQSSIWETTLPPPHQSGAAPANPPAIS